MKYWKLFIPHSADQDTVVFFITRKHPLAAKILGLQEIESGIAPGALEVYPNLYHWDEDGYHIEYQLIHEHNEILIDVIRKIED
ncbi:hypothetical protein KFU94_38175 [Chloroflexi bacterium TSY]|nr:hypothetical protein [Chloroflexi bacterium TSY]